MRKITTNAKIDLRLPYIPQIRDFRLSLQAACERISAVRGWPKAWGKRGTSPAMQKAKNRPSRSYAISYLNELPYRRDVVHVYRP